MRDAASVIYSKTHQGKDTQFGAQHTILAEAEPGVIFQQSIQVLHKIREQAQKRTVELGVKLLNVSSK